MVGTIVRPHTDAWAYQQIGDAVTGEIRHATVLELVLLVGHSIAVCADLQRLAAGMTRTMRQRHATGELRCDRYSREGLDTETHSAIEAAEDAHRYLGSVLACLADLQDSIAHLTDTLSTGEHPITNVSSARREARRAEAAPRAGGRGDADRGAGEAGTGRAALGNTESVLPPHLDDGEEY